MVGKILSRPKNGKAGHHRGVRYFGRFVPALNASSSMVPSGQSPRLLALFMCPRVPATTKPAPHDAARARAYSIDPYGSFSLATMREGKFNCLCGTTRKDAASAAGKVGPSGSGTATRNAPAIGRRAPRAAQCTTRRQARLWATKMGASAVLSIARSSASIQSFRSGLSQSAGWKRIIDASDLCQKVCQCVSPESPIPGRITVAVTTLPLSYRAEQGILPVRACGEQGNSSAAAPIY